MSKTWITKEGKEIPYKDLELSHLNNIIKFIERNAKNGIIIQHGSCGIDIDDMYYCEETLVGKDVKVMLGYYELKKELKRRLNQESK